MVLGYTCLNNAHMWFAKGLVQESNLSAIENKSSSYIGWLPDERICQRKLLALKETLL